MAVGRIIRRVAFVVAPIAAAAIIPPLVLVGAGVAAWALGYSCGQQSTTTKG
jgi:hypothetical protein